MKLWTGFAAAAALVATAGASAQDTELPPNFKGRITYSGTHEGEVVRPGPAPRRLTVRSLARAGGTTRQHSGTYNLVLDFDGSSVRGRYSGTGGMSSGTVSGTRSGSRCHLVDDLHGTVTESECTRTRFAATARLEQSSGVRTTIRIEAQAIQTAQAGTQRGSVGTGKAAARGGPVGSSGMARCWTLGFSAPRSQAELDAIPTINLLARADALNTDKYCWGLYIGAAALRGNVQGMAGYAYTFSKDSEYPDPGMETYWCQKAYRGAKANRVKHDLDAVNYFCPIETIAALMTPAERRANNVSIERARQTSAGIRAEAEQRGRALWMSLWQQSSGGLCANGQSTDGYSEGGRTVTVRCK